MESNRWNAGHYDEQIGYVSRLGRGLIELLKPMAGERVLDLGCGTGDLAYQISLSGADCTGLDSSEAMVSRARDKYPKLNFVQADGETFRLAEQQPFDAVFSNAALHWMKRPQLVAESVWLSLKSGGRFVAEFGGRGNVQSLVGAVIQAMNDLDRGAENIGSPWYFPSIGEYTALLERQGFDVGYAELYDRPTPLDGGEQGLRHWLEAFAGGLLAGLTAAVREDVYRSCEERLRPALWDGRQWIADYRRLRVTAVKPAAV